ncbi:MAG: UDP-N-acetylmuramoyl-L-alanine--D-glutamate ligase [Trueperaceae bacterium]
MNVLVYGLGRSGLAVTRLLKKQGHHVMAYDASPKNADIDELARLGVPLTVALTTEEVDLCIAAPGVPYDKPDLVALRERGIETIGEVEWVYRTIPATFIGVTGTAGKGSVTRWLTDVLLLGNLPTKAGGNIDPALAAVAEEGDVLVTELSSFQLERCPTLKPKIAIITNLGVDHLDRHYTVAAYHAAKHNILKNQTSPDVFIYNREDPVLCSWASEAAAKTLSFSTVGFSTVGFSTSNYEADACLLEQDGETWFRLHGTNLIAVSELHQKGTHQLANALAVALAAKEMGLDNEIIKQGLRNFKGIEGRYSVIKTLNGITFIEDSIATRTLAVKAALESTPSPIVWIAGGADKGATFEELTPFIKNKVSLFIGIGEAGERFAERVKDLTTTLVSKEVSGEAALHFACAQGVKHLQELEHLQTSKHLQTQYYKGTILLAPLAASFDQFKDYKDRAAAFKRVVDALELTRG